MVQLGWVRFSLVWFGCCGRGIGAGVLRDIFDNQSFTGSLARWEMVGNGYLSGLYNSLGASGMRLD